MRLLDVMKPGSSLLQQYNTCGLVCTLYHPQFSPCFHSVLQGAGRSLGLVFNAVPPEYKTEVLTPILQYSEILPHSCN